MVVVGNRAGLQQGSKQRPGLVAQQEIDDAHGRDLVAEAQVSGAKSNLAAAEEQAARQWRGVAEDQDVVRLHTGHGPFFRRDHEAVRR